MVINANKIQDKSFKERQHKQIKDKKLSGDLRYLKIKIISLNMSPWNDVPVRYGLRTST